MRQLKFFIFFISSFLFFSFSLHAIIVANSVELHLSVEDAELGQGIVQEVKLNHEEMDISKKSFMHRKISKVFHVAPGQYEIEWTTEKSEKPWGGKKEIKKHYRMIVIEMSDAVVYVNIRGENLTTY